MVHWATSALVAGEDTSALAILAGLPGDSPVFEAYPWLLKALAELSITMPLAAELRRAYVGAVSRAMLGGLIAPRVALNLVHTHAVGPLGHPPDLKPWCYVWEGLGPDDFRDLDAVQTDEEARSLAREWAGRPTLVSPSTGAS